MKLSEQINFLCATISDSQNRKVITIKSSGFSEGLQKPSHIEEQHFAILRLPVERAAKTVPTIKFSE